MWEHTFKTLIERSIGLDLFDGLLKKLQTIPSINAVASTDDLAIIIATQEQEEIGNRLYVAMRTVTPWCSETGLKLAKDKT